MEKLPEKNIYWEKSLEKTSRIVANEWFPVTPQEKFEVITDLRKTKMKQTIVEYDIEK